jgi:ABC-type lipopolysaccharide export system ATPase subunit
VLWCKDLRKRFKERLAVDGVGFEVAPGETYGLRLGVFSAWWGFTKWGRNRP